MAWIEVRNPYDKSKLLFRFDPERNLVEIVQRRCDPVIVDLARYRECQQGGTIQQTY